MVSVLGEETQHDHRLGNVQPLWKTCKSANILLNRCNLTVNKLRVLQYRPFEPLGPVDPRYPLAPGIPGTPVGPANPGHPVAPDDPRKPVAPVAPVFPCGPGGPETSFTVTHTHTHTHTHTVTRDHPYRDMSPYWARRFSTVPIGFNIGTL